MIQPYVHLDGVGSLSGSSCVDRFDDWLPQSTAQLGSLELKTLYVPPIDERGFAIQMTVHNTSESAQDVVIGLNGCWASSWHCVNEDKPLSGKATCFRSGWNSSLIFEYHAGFPMFAFAPMADAQTDSSFLPVPMMAVLLRFIPSLYNCCRWNSLGRILLGSRFRGSCCRNKRQRDASANFRCRTYKNKNCGFKSVVSPLMVMQSSHNSTIRICSSVCSSQLALHLTPKSWCSLPAEAPRYYVSAAYWDRDSLLWSFPAILDADPERAKEMLSYVFGRQRRNFGIHSRYIDGTVLEPGFELDELVAPLLALERYINKTDDKSILSDPDIVQGISLI